MGRFQGFYSGVDGAAESGNISETEVFTKRQQKKDRTTVSNRQLNIGGKDLSKCSSLSDYQNYVNKYNSPDNPYISEARQIIDDLTFANCKSIADYNNYLSQFPTGKNSIKAKVAIKRSQTSTTTTSTSSSYTPSSHNSSISGEDVWRFIKKVIGVIVILPLLILIYLCVTDKCTWTAVGGYGLFIVTPVCKWAFDS